MNTTLFHKVMRGVLLLSWLTYSGVAHAADVLPWVSRVASLSTQSVEMASR